LARSVARYVVVDADCVGSDHRIASGDLMRLPDPLAAYFDDLKHAWQLGYWQFLLCLATGAVIIVLLRIIVFTE
jgi:hypothetical protein